MVASLYWYYTVFYVFTLTKVCSRQASCIVEGTRLVLYINYRVPVKVCVGVVLKIVNVSRCVTG